MLLALLSELICLPSMEVPSHFMFTHRGVAKAHENMSHSEILQANQRGQYWHGYSCIWSGCHLHTQK